MMMKTKLASAVAMAITGTAMMAGGMSAANAAATTMYNLTTSNGDDNSANATDPAAGGTWALQGGTDGWIYGFSGPNPNQGAGGTNSVAKWAGTSGTNSTPFGYVGAHLNWAAEFSGGTGGNAIISTYDAFAKYGTYADIDTAQGAWSDNVSSNVGVKGGWRHDLDFGLFRTDVSGPVTLNVQGVINQGNTQYGFTIFEGMNTNASYGHHGSWNSTTNDSGITGNSLPGGGTNLPTSAIVAYSVGDPATNIGSISFNATAGQIYTIVLGGYRTGDWNTTLDGYRLNISQAAAPVPIPAAVWLFGSALAGLGVIGRRKDPAAAA